MLRLPVGPGNTFLVNGLPVVLVANDPGATVILGSLVGGAFVGGTPPTPGTLRAALGGGTLGLGLSIDPRGLTI